MSREDYDARLPRLRAELLHAHQALRRQSFPVLVIVSGADGAGKGELVHRLNEWLDPRGVETHAFWDESDEERERPPYFRFWRAMPGRGRIGILFGSWYSRPIIRRVYGKCGRKALGRELERIVAFERMLVEDGAAIVKVWLHLTKKRQKAALKKLDRAGRATPTDWKHFEMYDRFVEVSERALRRTDSLHAPWHVIDASDRRTREFSVGTILLEAIRRRCDDAAREAAEPAAVPASAAPAVAASGAAAAETVRPSVLDRVDLGRALPEEEYRERLQALQKKLSKLAWRARERKRSIVMVFEGWDAGGKGSAIRRVTQALDPRLYSIVGVAAPTDEERAQHYLWRFWRRLPRAGFTTMFDRSWYGRVLVERVEGFADAAAWGRAYAEINDFERQLVEHGIVLLKFWIHISPEEQLRRFEERQRLSYKQYKITEEDWRNRAKWERYRQAVDDMVRRCDTAHAPWTLVAGDDKRFARVRILKTIVKRCKRAL